MCACNVWDFDWPSVINNLIFTPLAQCRRFKQKTIALIEITSAIFFFCTFSIFLRQSLSQPRICKGCTNVKFVSILQIVPNNDILIGRESEICRDGFRFFSNGKIEDRFETSTNALDGRSFARRFRMRFSLSLIIGIFSRDRAR